MEACFSETVVNFFHATQYHIRQNLKPHNECIALCIHIYCPTLELQLLLYRDVVMPLKRTSGHTGLCMRQNGFLQLRPLHQI